MISPLTYSIMGFDTQIEFEMCIYPMYWLLFTIITSVYNFYKNGVLKFLPIILQFTFRNNIIIVKINFYIYKKRESK